MALKLRSIVYMIKYDNTKSGNVSSVGKTAMCKKTLWTYDRFWKKINKKNKKKSLPTLPSNFGKVTLNKQLFFLAQLRNYS
jgi:hypothetical protein